MHDLQQWQGRSEFMRDEITAGPLRGLSALLDRDEPAYVSGAELPPLAHWIFFLTAVPQRDLGLDGRPRAGGILPHLPLLPRRAWAGCSVQWLAPLRVGDLAQRVSRLESLTRKQGRNGELVFVRVRHEISNAQGIAIVGEDNMVYRPAPTPAEVAGQPVAAPRNATWSREIVPDPVMLFRYSALTFNGSRQHYDREYATQVDGLPGLMVHGPLINQFMVDLVRKEMPGAVLTSFTYKALRPTYDLHPFEVHGRPSDDGKTVELWSSDYEGWLTMQATVTFS